MLREITGWLVVLLLLAGVGGFAWLTRHPDAPWLERAEDWPGIGPLAERFRRAYLGPPPGEATAAAESEPEPTVVIVRPPLGDEPIDLTGGARPAKPERGGGPAGASPERPAPPALVPMLPDLAAAGEAVAAGEVRIPEPGIPMSRLPAFALPPPASRRAVERTWLLPGTVLRSAPAPGGAEVERSRELASVPVLERRGDWLRVRLRGHDGWADPATPVIEVGRAGFASFAGRYAAQPRGSVLRTAKQMLGLREPSGRLGPFALYTDVEDRELLALLDGVAARLDEAYGARYGLGLPKRRARPQIALFAEEAHFRALARATKGAPVHARGFASGGLVVFYVGGDPWQTVITGFVHELTHTLNRHALGAALPPWLEEGLAEDLGGVWLEDPDAPSPGMTHPGDGSRHGWTLQGLVGAVAIGGLEGWAPLAELTALDRTGFFADRQGVNYKQSQLFVRCLLDAGDERLAGGFRGFLSDTAEGYPPGAEELIERLGHGWPELERICRDHHRDLTAEIGRLLPDGMSVAGIP